MKKLIVLFLAVFLLLNTACGYIAKNHSHEVYSNAKYGSDKFLKVRDYNIHYVEHGEGETVFLISGLFGTYKEWERLMPILSRHYNVIAIDHIGVGDSDKPGNEFGYTVHEQADLVIDMLNGMGISKVHIVGVSYGGMIALNIAARHPQRVNSIVCIEGAVIMPKKLPYDFLEAGLTLPVFGDIIIGLIRSGLIDNSITKSIMGKGWEKLNNEEKQEIKEIVSHNAKTSSRSAWHALTRALKITKNFDEEAKSIQTRVLYLYGEETSFKEMIDTNVNFFRANLPHFEIKSFQDGVHDLQLQKPDEIANLIVDFFDNNEETRITAEKDNSNVQ
jgi:pimeloyl-ACP methyl ester carboxylesterase